jgi:hypothetical protein
MKLAWPEKVVVWVAVFVGVIMLLFWAGPSDGIGWAHDSRLNVAILHWYVEGLLVLLLPLWVILRTVYFISDRW